MGRIAFVFSGQGDQHSGMGKDIYDAYPKAKEVYDALDGIRANTSNECFYADGEVLKQTKNTQPDLFAYEATVAATLTEMGLKADCVAGFSLGEVVAATYAGVFTLDEGFKAVIERGKLMQSANEQTATAMTAVLKLSEEKVEELASRFPELYAVNYNCPGQTVVSGNVESMPAFEAEVKKEGGRAMRLNVSGAFHSPFMKSASEGFANVLDAIELKSPTVELYSDYTGTIYGEDIKGLLSLQISSPVRWSALISNMLESGVDTFVEIGPGRTLCNLISRISKSVRTYSTCDVASIEKLKAELI